MDQPHVNRRRFPVLGALLVTALAMFAAACSNEVSGTLDIDIDAPTSTPAPLPSVTTPDSTDTSSTAAPPTMGSDGVWEIDGYGYIIRIANGMIDQAFLPVADYCMPADFPPELLGFEMDGDDAATIDLSASITQYRLRRITLPPACETFSFDVSPAETVEAFIELFDEHYPFFADRQVDWPAEQSQLRADAADATSTEEAANLINALMWRIGDGHNGVDASDGPPAEAAESYFALMAELESAVADVEIALRGSRQTSANGALAWGSTDGVGYLRIERLASMTEDGSDQKDLEVFRSMLDEALIDLQKFDSLIVDLRTNGGGNDELSLEAVSRFVSQPAILFTKEAFAAPTATRQTVSVEPSANATFEGQVYVLVSPATASAAEILGVGLREGAGAIVVGPRSEGIFSDTIPWYLPGGVEMQMSMEVYRDLDGASYEVRGVPVDEQATIANAFTVARDLALRAN